MKTTVVRYQVSPSQAETNANLIRNVFRELDAKRPEGLHYMAVKLPDDTFVHVASVDDETVPNPLPRLEAFQAFVADLNARIAGQREQNEATVIGSYRMGQ